MISNNSLQAFSGATTTAPIGRTPQADGVRLVRAQPDQGIRQAAPTAAAIPETRPSIPPPRGSLLNLSV